MKENHQQLIEDEEELVEAAAASFASQWAAICRTMGKVGVELDENKVPDGVKSTWAASGELVGLFTEGEAKYALEPTTLSVTEQRRDGGWIDERVYSPQGELLHEQRVPVPGSEPWN